MALEDGILCNYTTMVQVHILKLALALCGLASRPKWVPTRGAKHNKHTLYVIEAPSISRCVELRTGGVEAERKHNHRHSQVP